MVPLALEQHDVRPVLDWENELVRNTAIVSLEDLVKAAVPEPDFSPESTTRGGGGEEAPSKQAVGPKIYKILAKSYQNFINLQKFCEMLTSF